MSKEVAKKQSTEVVDLGIDAWDFDGVDSRDIIIPRLLLLQSNSSLVAEGKGEAGDIIDTTSYVVRGSGHIKRKKDIEIIPFKIFNSILVERVEGEDKKYVSNNPILPGDQIPDYEVPQADGSVIRSGMCHNLFALDVETLDDPSSLPYIITFKGGSRMAGKKLGDYFNGCLRAMSAGFKDHRAIPAGHVFKLGAVSTKNNDGRPYYALEALKDKPSTIEQIKTAKLWLDAMKTKNVVTAKDEDGAPF